MYPIRRSIPARSPVARRTDWSTLKLLCGQVRMFARQPQACPYGPKLPAGSPYTSPPALLGGVGHLCQGRFKSLTVQVDEDLLTVLRYVERNPVRAGLAEHAELWRWGSAWARGQRSSARRR
jgi:hypothetical protein